MQLQSSQTDLEGNHGAAGEVISTSSSCVVASGGADGSNEAVGEEGTHTVGVAQGQDVDVHLGGTGEGDSAHISGDDVDVAVWDCNGTGISVHQTLVIELQQENTRRSGALHYAHITALCSHYCIMLTLLDLMWTGEG